MSSLHLSREKNNITGSYCREQSYNITNKTSVFNHTQNYALSTVQVRNTQFTATIDWWSRGYLCPAQENRDREQQETGSLMSAPGYIKSRTPLIYIFSTILGKKIQPTFLSWGVPCGRRRSNTEQNNPSWELSRTSSSAKFLPPPFFFNTTKKQNKTAQQDLVQMWPYLYSAVRMKQDE